MYNTQKSQTVYYTSLAQFFNVFLCFFHWIFSLFVYSKKQNKKNVNEPENKVWEVWIERKSENSQQSEIHQ